MATLFTDSFTRADADDVGANWDNTDDAGQAQWDIVSNALRSVTFSTGPGRKITAAAAHAATVDVKVTVTQKSATADGGPVVRGPATSGGGALTAYGTFVGGNECSIYRWDNSATETVLRVASVTQVANGVIALQAEGTGGTVTLKQYYQGVQAGADYLDTSANRIVAAGRTGVVTWKNEGLGAGTGDYVDFLVEDLAAPAVLPFTLTNRGTRPRPFAPGLAR